MSLGQQISLCSEHYERWKNYALSATSTEESRKALKRAFFWLEVQSAFIILHAVDQTEGNDPQTKEKLIIAKANLSKRLADYAEEILSELDGS